MAETPPPDSPAESPSPDPEAPGAGANPILGSVTDGSSASPLESSSVNDAELPDTGLAPDGTPLDLGFILDIPLNVTVEVGRTKLLVQELLQLGQGSVIELDKQMGEPFEVLVNEKLVARGEIVVVNDRFGVRLTDIISPTERVHSLA